MPEPKPKSKPEPTAEQMKFNDMMDGYFEERGDSFLDKLFALFEEKKKSTGNRGWKFPWEA